MTDEAQLEMENNIMATGAVSGALIAGMDPKNINVVLDDKGQATNALIVRFDFLRSPYRVTVERIPE